MLSLLSINAHIWAQTFTVEHKHSLFSTNTHFWAQTMTFEHKPSLSRASRDRWAQTITCEVTSEHFIEAHLRIWGIDMMTIDWSLTCLPTTTTELNSLHCCNNKWILYKQVNKLTRYCGHMYVCISIVIINWIQWVISRLFENFHQAHLSFFGADFEAQVVRARPEPPLCAHVCVDCQQLSNHVHSPTCTSIGTCVQPLCTCVQPLGTCV